LPISFFINSESSSRTKARSRGPLPSPIRSDKAIRGGKAGIELKTSIKNPEKKKRQTGSEKWRRKAKKRY